MEHELDPDQTFPSPSNIILLSSQGCRPPTVLVSQILLMRITYALALNGPVWEICLVINGYYIAFPV